jgi:hypothetical protein
MGDQSLNCNGETRESELEFTPFCRDNGELSHDRHMRYGNYRTRGRGVEDVCRTLHRSWLSFVSHFVRGSIAKPCGLDWYLLVQIRGLPWQVAIESANRERPARPVQPKNG